MWLSDLLMVALVLFLTRLRGVELAAAGAYVACSVIHTILTLVVPVSDLIYYASAVLADFIALTALCSIRPVGDMVYGLARVCVISMSLNVYGLMIYGAAWPPWSYDLAFIGVYAYALVVVGRGGANGVGGGAVRWHLAVPAFPNRGRACGPKTASKEEGA
ncbi:hypothetical protein [Vibrio phage CKB-S1]|nr:hypothetical protein [Vibrio phage CKB-S1]